MGDEHGHRRDRAPVGAIAVVGQGPEVRQPVNGDVAVEGEVAEHAQHPAAAGDRRIQVHPAVHVVARQVDGLVVAKQGRAGAVPALFVAGVEGKVQLAGGQGQDRPRRQQMHIGRVGARGGEVGRQQARQRRIDRSERIESRVQSVDALLQGQPIDPGVGSGAAVGMVVGAVQGEAPLSGVTVERGPEVAGPAVGNLTQGPEA